MHFTFGRLVCAAWICAGFAAAQQRPVTFDLPPQFSLGITDASKLAILPISTMTDMTTS